jgi:hypothetical protein
MLILSNDRYTVYFDGWRPRVIKTWISGVETAILRGTPEQQVEELKCRLRYVGIRNRVTDPKWKEKKKKVKAKA